jgi:hypothetical protein
MSAVSDIMTEPVQDTILAESGAEDDASRNNVVTSARQSVYDNSLIMSEIYGWISRKRDLIPCLAVCKAGWLEVARILYRQLDLEIAARLEVWCSHVSQFRCPKDRNGPSEPNQMICLGCRTASFGSRSTCVYSIGQVVPLTMNFRRMKIRDAGQLLNPYHSENFGTWKSCD